MNHHRLLTSVGLGQVTPAEFLWTRTAPEEDHHRVIAAALGPPADWRRPVGRLRTTWLRTIDDDLQALNFGVQTAWRKARDRDFWHQKSSVRQRSTVLHRPDPHLCQK